MTNNPRWLAQGRTKTIAELLAARRHRLLGTGDGDRPGTVDTGFSVVDEMLGGFHLGSLNVLGSLPSFGKTCLAINIAVHAAVSQRHKALYVALSIAEHFVMRVMVGFRASVNVTRLGLGRLSVAETHRVKASMDALAASPLQVCDAFGLTLEDVLTQIDRTYDHINRESPHQLRLVVIDSLRGLGLGRRKSNRPHEVDCVVASLREMAHDLGIAVLLLADLRWYETDLDELRQPTASDLKYFHTIAPYADTVVLLHRPSDSDGPDALLMVAHNKHGATMTSPLRFNRSTLRFTEYGPDSPVPG